MSVLRHVQYRQSVKTPESHRLLFQTKYKAKDRDLIHSYKMKDGEDRFIKHALEVGGFSLFVEFSSLPCGEFRFEIKSAA